MAAEKNEKEKLSDLYNESFYCHRDNEGSGYH